MVLLALQQTIIAYKPEFSKVMNNGRKEKKN